MKPLEVQECPFANLPQAKEGRWGAGLTAAKMKDCVWLRPQLVGEFQYTEWTGDGHLRQSSFIGLRTDKKAKDVMRAHCAPRLRTGPAGAGSLRP
jgi:ATP-dependent DNA ligase